MATGPVKLFELELLEYEKKPDYPRDCMEFNAVATLGTFCGCTRFSVYKRDLEDFLDKLDTMARDFSGKAHLKCGWGETVNFEMKAYYFDRLGHIAVEIEIADPGPRERMHRLLVEYNSEPELLGRMAVQWRKMQTVGDKAAIRFG